MAKFKPYHCLQDQLSFLPVEDGQLIFTTDTNRIYADIEEVRILFSDNAALTQAIAEKIAKTDIVSAFDIEQTYTDNQIYNANAINEMGSLWAEGIEAVEKELKEDIDANTAEINKKANTADLATVATSGNYNDLLEKPTIPSIEGLATEKYVDDIVAELPGQEELDAFGAEVMRLLDTKANNTTVTGIDNRVTNLEAEVENIAVYSIVETTVTEGYAKTYSLTKDGVETGAKINVPKDLVVNAGSVEVVTTAGVPYTGAVVGDKYIDLTLNDAAEDHIYIPVKDLVDAYTGSDGAKIKVTVNSDNSISAEIKAGAITRTELSNDLQSQINNITTITINRWEADA